MLKESKKTTKDFPKKNSWTPKKVISPFEKPFKIIDLSDLYEWQKAVFNTETIPKHLPI